MIIGELHGSAETPQVVSHVLRVALGHPGPVALGLEMPLCLLAEQLPPDRLLRLPTDAESGECNRGALEYGGLTLELRDTVRAALVQAPRLRVFALETSARGRAGGSSFDASAWERQVAGRTRTVARTARVVVLTGNLHGRKATYDDLAQHPMTPFAQLLGADARNVSVDSAHPGQVYGCWIEGKDQVCKTQAVRPSALRPPGLYCDGALAGYDCQAVVDHVTAARRIE